MAYALYYATSPAPSKVDKEVLQRLVAVHFSTEQDAFYAAALVLRGGQYVWLIEGRTCARARRRSRNAAGRYSRCSSAARR